MLQNSCKQKQHQIHITGPTVQQNKILSILVGKFALNMIWRYHLWYTQSLVTPLISFFPQCFHFRPKSRMIL